MTYSSILLATTTAAAAVAAAFVTADGHNIYARQNEDLMVSTVSPETVTTSIENALTTEVTISGASSTFTFNAAGTDSTEVTVTDTGLTTTIEDATIESTFGATETIITVSPNEEVDITLTEISTEITLTPISTVLLLEEIQTAVSMSDLITQLSIADGSTIVTFDGTTTTIAISGTSTDATVTGPSTEVILSAVSTIISLEGTSTTVSIGSTSFSTSLGAVQAIVETLSYATTESVQLSYSESVFSLARESTVVTLTYPSTEIVLSVPETVATVSGAGTTTVITIPEVVTTITLSESSSSSNISESESSTTIVVSSTEISISSVITPSVTLYPPSFGNTTQPSFANTTQPTYFPTYCEAVLGPISFEDAVFLLVLFDDRNGTSSFIDYVTDYVSDLLVDVDDLAVTAMAHTDYAFSTEFEDVDYPGILGLASAAPVYTCHLSSLWGKALSNPQQYAKRAVPSPEDNTKMIVLFEKHYSNENQEFNYANLISDETNELVDQVESVSSAAAVAAANDDLDAYSSLFSDVNVDQLLSIATQAPIYTEGLSAAYAARLSNYNPTTNVPTTVFNTTRTYTTVTTIVTNVLNGNITSPTVIINTVVVTTALPPGEIGTGPDVTSPSRSTPVLQSPVSASNGNAYYTRVQNGVTYTNVIAVQTANFAKKMGVGWGAGLLGVAALLV